jgi:putative heterogeneous nuclear ribonucleoprotein A1
VGNFSNNHDGQHDAIIPNKMRGEGIRLGGSIKEIWKWTETVRIED